MTHPCRHTKGDWIAEKGFFLCLICWARLEEWPRTYGAPQKRSEYDVPRQVIVWKAEKSVSQCGTALNDFLSCMARRYRQKTRPMMALSDAYDVAIDYLESFPDPFGHVDYDWSMDSAREMADDDISYWDESWSGDDQ